MPLEDSYIDDVHAWVELNEDEVLLPHPVGTEPYTLRSRATTISRV